MRNPTDTDHSFYVLQLNGGTDLEFRFRDDAGVVHQANVTSAITPGAWSYIALTYDGSTLTSYVDGNIGTVNNNASGSFSSAAYAFNIGEDGDGREVNGVIDEVRSKSGGEIVVVTMRDLGGQATTDNVTNAVCKALEG